MEEIRKPVAALTDKERFPLLRDLTFLNQLKQDLCAPKYNFQSGDRLQHHHLKKVHEYAASLKTATFQQSNKIPAWMNDYLKWCVDTVPFYKGSSNSFEELPTMRRADIHAAPWSFVSGECNLNDLLVYQTSGTTGPAMNVLFDPISQASWISQLESVLARFDISLTRGSGSTAIALICDQEQTLTYASLSTYLEGAGVLKINLNKNEWKREQDRIEYLERYNPEILTGDPFAFLSLLSLKPKITPKALVSSAMKLTSGIRQLLEDYFRCPVLDIYSLTECRMIAVAETPDRHRAIRPELFLEIFHPEKDIPLQEGERGELVVTGGINPFLPMIRYRTGDFCSLKIEDGTPYLINLEARTPVFFYRHDNTFVNNVDISRALMDLPLAGFNLHQHTDKRMVFKGWSDVPNLEAVIAEKLKSVIGKGILIEVMVEEVGRGGEKGVVYSSDLEYGIGA